MSPVIRHSVLLLTLLQVFVLESTAQTGFSYVGPPPCLGTNSFVNGQLVIDDPPPPPFTFTWTVIDPLGEVTVSSVADPLGVVFDIAGCWSVELEVNGVVVESDACGVEVFNEPTAAIDPVSVAGCLPFTPILDDASIPGSGAIDQWNWSIGFCPSISDQNVNGQLCPLGVGAFDVQLSVTDENGCFNTIDLEDLITISGSPPNASFIASSLVDCNAPVDISFASTSSVYNGMHTHDWTIDGAPIGLGEDTLFHTFTAPGSYEVCVVVMDDYGCSDDFCQTIEIFDTPLADFSIEPAVICAGMNVEFTNASTPTPIPNISWDLDGDGTIDDSGAVVNNVYTAAGSYEAELFITYSDHCQDSLIQTITVDPPIEALFSIDTLYGCSLPFSITLDDMSTGTGPLTYDWYVTDEDGATTSFIPIGDNHVFTDWGSYTVSLTLSNDNGCIDQFVFPQPIILQEPRLEFYLDAASTCVGDEIATVITWAQSLDPFVNWYYDIGCDGSIDQQILGETDGNTTFIFSAPGTYTICLTAESENGCSDTWQDDITIAPAIFSSFTVSDETPCGIDSVLFSATSPEPGLTYEWVYGDGATSGLGGFETSLYSYCDTGYFDITLNVSNNGCFTSSTIDSLIYVAAPIADFAINTNCTDYYTVGFTNLSILPDTSEMIWVIDGDTLYIGEWEPTHTFSTEGIHEVTLWVDNDSTGCADLKRRTVKINEPTFDVDIGPTTGCPPVVVNIEPQDVDCVQSWNVALEGSDFLYAQSALNWDLDWSVNGETGSPNNVATIDWPVVVYTQLGTYDISMTIVDGNGCQIDTLMEDIITVDIDPYFARFDSVVTRYCDSTVVCVSPEQSGLSDWQWSTSGGQSSMAEDTCFTFFPPYDQTVGEIITLSANDTGGCTSTVSDSLFLDRSTTACFSINELRPCKGEEVMLDAACTVCDVAPCELLWDLDGDGDHDDASGPIASISFSENGDYVLSLMATDDQGCTSVTSQSVTVHTPEIEVLITQTIFACISTITIENISTGPGISTSWEISGFNEGGPITPFIGNSPSGQPQTAGINENAIGVYDLSLIVSNQFGCDADSIINDFLGYGEAVGDFNCTLEAQDCAPFTVECQAFNPTDNTFDYTWNMGDNTPYSTTTISHDYVEGGTYQVTLTMTDPENDCTFSLSSDPIVVTELTWAVDGLLTVCPGDSALVTVSGLDSLEWQSPLPSISAAGEDTWYLTPEGSTDFVSIGYLDGCLGNQTLTVDNFALPIYSVDPYGPFCQNAGDVGLPTVSPSGGEFILDGIDVTTVNSTSLDSSWTAIDYLYVDGNGCESSHLIELVLLDTTSISLDIPDSCIDGDPVDLAAASSDGAGLFIFSYDGAIADTASTFSPASIVDYPEVGTDYIVDYLFENSEGCMSQVSDVLTVHPLPVAAFTVNEVCTGEEVEFIQQSTVSSGIIDGFEWDIEGLGTTDMPLPGDVSYDEAGDYVVWLEVETDAACLASVSDTIRVHPDPLLSLSSADACQDDGIVLESQSSIGSGTITEVIIDWGDGVSEENGNTAIAHPYETTGEFNILVTATSDVGCSTEENVTVTIHPEPMAVTLMDDHCSGDMGMAIDSSTISSGSIATIEWIIEEESASYSGPGFEHVFSSAGDYTIDQFVISDQGCADTTTFSITVLPLPEPMYTMSDLAACTGAELYLTDISTVAPPYSIDSVAWIANGQVMSGGMVTYVFPITQLVDIAMEVYTDVGCTAALEEFEVLEVTARPVSSFYITPSELTIAENVAHFIDESSFATQWHYHLEDGTIYTGPNATHTFEEIGEYTVLQIVENEIGCVDSSWQVIEVLPSLLVYVPTAVTMDGDGLNDQFRPVISGDAIDEYLLRIFDRDGHIVFESSDVNEPWNGNVQGGDYYAQDDVYNWQLMVKGVNGTLEKIMGRVTVLR